MTELHVVSGDDRIGDPEAGEGEALSPREMLFVDALATGKPLGDAATAAGISSRSGRRWKAKPHIAEAIRARLNENVAVGRAILAAGMSKAATALVSMASGESKADPGRVSACRAVTEVLRGMADDEVQARLAALETQLGTKPSGGFGC